jgi:general secretion pathway protein D
MRHSMQVRVLAVVIVGVCLLATSDLSAQMRSSARSGMGGARDSYGASVAEDIMFEYDQETGSLIVITDEETNQHIQRIIESLDRPVPQVLIKVLFLEVTHGDDLDLGVEGLFEFKGNNADDRNIVEAAFGLAAETQGGFFRIIEEDLEVTIRAIAEVAKLEVLSRPSILARNNQPAKITIGQEVPFVRNTRITQDGQIINTVEYEDIGIILEVTPHITSDRLVELEVMPEISTLTGETVPISDTIDSPVFAKRSAETRVVVPDGKTVVIGGLMEDNETLTVRKVPLLGDIPWLGVLFRRTITSKAKTELLIFLTPHVVEGPSQLRDMSLAEKNKTELVPKAFSDEQMDKYIDNLDD